MNLYDCPPSPSVNDQPPKDATILELAARASEASNAYRDCMSERRPFRETMSYAGALARATDALTTAIADAVAMGDGQIHLS